MNVRHSRAALIVAVAALITLTACTAAPQSASPDAPSVETEAPIVAPETSCPDGFIDAYAAASASAFEAGYVVTETDVASFEPAFLSPFLDGGCAVHVTGTQIGASGGFPIDADYGFAPDAATADAIADAFEDHDYLADPNFPGGYATADFTSFGAVFPIGGEVSVPGSEALEQFYPAGVTFYG